jgi:tetratricopeptide (TPR) repeat protein
MARSKKLIILLISILLASVSIAQQHPNQKKIDSLKNVLPTTHGIQRIDCLNALGEEYWWPPKVYPDTISNLANLALKEATTLKYEPGIAGATMLLGVAEIYRKNFRSSEKYLRKALSMFEAIDNDFSVGWCYVWLAQALHSQINFGEALSCYKKSIPFLERSGDWEGEGKSLAWMGSIYATLGDYDSSFYYCNKSLLLRKKMSDHVCVANSLVNMGQLYKAAGAYDEALEYYRQGFRYANSHDVDLYTANWAYLEPVGSVFRLMNLPDSSTFYLQKALQSDPTNQMTRISFAETLLLKKEYDSALNIFLQPIEHFRAENNRWDLMRVMLDAAKTYEKKNENSTALRYALENFSMAQKSKAKHYMLDSYLLLARLYNRLHRNDSAYFYMQQFTALKDSVVRNQFLFKLSNYKKQAEYKKQIDQLSLLDKENNIQENKLKQEALLKWILLACLLVAALSAFSIYKNLTLKRRNEKLENRHKQAQLQQHVTHVEMQALRAQMNPHFIFNCLSSINRFILKNETEAASNYLTKFSRLIRMVLLNSKKEFISLEDELETLCLYLDMEKLRFKDAIDYRITFINSIDAGNVFVPPLLLQPFAENAIWHGLMHKEGHGHLEIELSIDKKILTCAITDNGVGRKKAAEVKSKSVEKQKSMGLQITTERLALLNKNHDEQTFFDIEDITDNEGEPAGTRVILKMNYKDPTEAVSDKIIAEHDYRINS